MLRLPLRLTLSFRPQRSGVEESKIPVLPHTLFSSSVVSAATDMGNSSENRSSPNHSDRPPLSFRAQRSGVEESKIPVLPHTLFSSSVVSAATDMGNYHENRRQTHTVIPAKAGIHRVGLSVGL